MKVFRIAKNEYISRLDGVGSYLHGGRWTSIGTFAVYTAENRSLAYLEYIVHQIPLAQWPVEVAIATIEVDESKIFTLSTNDLPSGWDDLLVRDTTKEIGGHFFSMGHLALRIPSVIVPGEFNVI